MSRRDDNDRTLYMEVAQSAVSSYMSFYGYDFVVNTEALTEESFVELERGARLFIIGSDGALTMNDIRSSDHYLVHATTMCKVNEVTAQNDRLRLALLEKVKTDYSDDDDEGRAEFARKRIKASVLLLEEIYTKLMSANLDEPYLRSCSSQRVLVVLTAELFAYEALFDDYVEIKNCEGAVRVATYMCASTIFPTCVGESKSRKECFDEAKCIGDL